MTHEVNTHNWKSNDAFLDFLQLQYQPSRETAEQCILLLPVAVAEERLLGAIKETILTEAIARWNELERFHTFYFSPSAKRWVYRGTEVKSPINYDSEIKLLGRLRAPIPVGAFCNEPRSMMI